MITYVTKLTKNSPVPTQIDFLEAAHQRGLLKNTKEIRLYQNLAKGDQGEQFVIDALEEYGNSNWIVLPNLWQDHYGIYESDIILITYCAIYVLEVKNFDGLFEYKNNRCYINGRRIKEDYIHQTEKSFINMTNIMQKIDSRIPVKGVILFVGEHSEVDIVSEVADIAVIPRNNVRKYIQHITHEEQNYLGVPIDTSKVISALENNEVISPFAPKDSYSTLDLKAACKGIHCECCKSFQITHSKKFINCTCGHREVRKHALLRMIDEYKLLTFNDKYFYRSDLSDFLGNKISRTFLSRFLTSNYEAIHKGRYAKYKH